MQFNSTQSHPSTIAPLLTASQPTPLTTKPTRTGRVATIPLCIKTIALSQEHRLSGSPASRSPVVDLIYRSDSFAAIWQKPRACLSCFLLFACLCCCLLLMTEEVPGLRAGRGNKRRASSSSSSLLLARQRYPIVGFFHSSKPERARALCSGWIRFLVFFLFFFFSARLSSFLGRLMRRVRCIYRRSRMQSVERKQ